MGISLKGIGRAISKGVHDVGAEAGRVVNRVTNNDKPDPLRLTSTQGSAPGGIPGAPPGVPAGAPNGGTPAPLSLNNMPSFDQAGYEAQLRNQFGVGDVLDGIKNFGGDVWGVIQKVAGSDWAKIIASGAKGVADFIASHKEDILAAANVGLAAYRQTQADNYAKKAYDTTTKAYDAKAPLRDTGIAGMLNPNASVPDLSSLKHIAGAGSGNPFAGALPLGNLATPTAPTEHLPPLRIPLSPPAPTAPPAPPMMAQPPATPPATPPAGVPAGPNRPLPLGPVSRQPQRPPALPLAGIPLSPLTNRGY